MTIAYIIQDGIAMPVNQQRTYGLSEEELPLMDVSKRIVAGIAPYLKANEVVEVVRQDRMVSVRKYVKKKQ